MATTFMEPGGDATYDGKLFASFFGSVVTDHVHGGHVKSIKCIGLQYGQGANSGATGRTSFYLYVNALGASRKQILHIANTKFRFELALTAAGVLQINDGFDGSQVGSDGATLSTGTWYRITVCWNATSTTVNEIRVYVNGGTASISISNGTFTSNGASISYYGNPDSTGALDCRYSDIYADDSSSANDIATDVWVTAKRPNANGTTNNFSTQIGSGGSGYGSGHSPQVNERALSETNGWSMIGAGSAVTEEYTVEAAATGDIDVSAATLIDWGTWAWASSLSNETASLITGGASSNAALTSTPAIFRGFKGSSTYPAGNTDVGLITTTALTTVSLYECGVLVAYTPAPPSTLLPLPGMNTSFQN